MTLGATAVKIYNAIKGTGKDDNKLTMTVTVTVPAKALPGHYSTTLTVVGTDVTP